MLDESKLKKIVSILNDPINFDNYTEILESIDLILSVYDEDNDYFLCPEEANLQLPSVFLRQTKLLESKQFIKANSDSEIGHDFYLNCQNILDFLESVELQEPEFMESKKAPELDMKLLRELVKKYIY